MWHFSIFLSPVLASVLPSPLSVMHALFKNVTDIFFWNTVASSFWRIFIGYFTAIFIGGMIGITLSWYREFARSLNSVFLGLQSFPSICWIPIASLWFGFGSGAVIFVVVLGSIFSIIIGFEQAFSSVPPIYIKAARTMGSSGLKLYFEIIVPAAIPQILYVLKLGWSYAWRTLVGSEIIIAVLGIGKLFKEAQSGEQMANLFALNIFIMLISIFVDCGIFGLLDKYIQKNRGDVC